MKRDDDDRDWVKREAEIMGMDLSNHDAVIVLKKWRSTPTLALRDLLASLRQLQEVHRADVLRHTNQMLIRSLTIL